MHSLPKVPPRRWRWFYVGHSQDITFSPKNARWVFGLVLAIHDMCTLTRQDVDGRSRTERRPERGEKRNCTRETPSRWDFRPENQETEAKLKLIFMRLKPFFVDLSENVVCWSSHDFMKVDTKVATKWELCCPWGIFHGNLSDPLFGAVNAQTIHRKPCACI